MSMKINKELVWIIFISSLIVIGIDCLGILVGVQMRDYLWFRVLFLGLPILLLITHSIVTLTSSRALFLIALSLLAGLMVEAWGLSYGTLFGGHYVYHFGQFTFAGVPLEVVSYWAVFIYSGYSIVSSFFYWAHKEKPSIIHRNGWFLPITIVCDGLVVTAIDLFMDPLQVKLGHWTWIEGGSYFGVPLGNFVGWFIVTVFVTGIFRTFEYFFPDTKTAFSKSIFLIPILGYAVLMLSFIFLSIQCRMYDLALIGTALMLPTIMVNIYVVHLRERFSFDLGSAHESPVERV